MAFGKAKKMVRHAKISIRGTLKSGKTTTAAMLAAYIAKKYHPGKPVSFVPTEPGIDFVLNIFAAEGLEVIEPVDERGVPLRSRDYTVLKSAIPDSIASGAGVLLVDNLTHFREDLVRAYKVAIGATKFKDGVKVSDRKLKPFEYMPVNEQWAEFTAMMTAAPLEIIVLGRLGKIFEELENEEGETDIHQIGNKMKAGSDTEYEVDLIAEMESRPDPDFANAEKVPVLGPPDAKGERKVRRKQLVRKFEQRNIHVFTVAGCRVWALNGQSCIMKSADAYKKGMCDQIGQFCAPYFDFLKTGEETTGSPLNLGSKSESVFPAGESMGNWLKQRTIAIEEWDHIMKVMLPGSTQKEKRLETMIYDAIAPNVKGSRTAFESRRVEEIRFDVLVLRKLEAIVQDEGLPWNAEKVSDARQAVNALVEKARVLAGKEWEILKSQPAPSARPNGHGQPQPIVNQLEIQAEDIPF